MRLPMPPPEAIRAAHGSGTGGPEPGDEDGGEATAADLATLAVDRKGPGQPVDAGLAARIGSHTGVDVSDARVHADPVSQQATRGMHARAFAFGDDVFLGPGESATDPKLMGHELAHVAQQRGSTAQPQRKVEVGEANSPAEQHADQVGAQVAAGAPPQQLLADAPPLAPGQMLKTEFWPRSSRPSSPRSSRSSARSAPRPAARTSSSTSRSTAISRRRPPRR